MVPQSPVRSLFRPAASSHMPNDDGTAHTNRLDAARSAILAVGFRHGITAPSVEAGYERFAALTDTPVGYDAFRDAIDACLRDGLIREPIRLPEGALQCHWHLELTPQGVAEARRR
ncbi:MAG TPA: hypothetical protein VHB27_01895 [Rhodopila sp.]|uniref:hypothetical protein n=1 Tax=Rhodopila sp. TaxID=2480087 RepID=UPI002BFF6C00|nr:hypothetical protein [Rhodopila sp.]HVY13951.1 hypothetical protein [Rhodopila sp.]